MTCKCASGKPCGCDLGSFQPDGRVFDNFYPPDAFPSNPVGLNSGTDNTFYAMESDDSLDGSGPYGGQQGWGTVEANNYRSGPGGYDQAAQVGYSATGTGVAGPKTGKVFDFEDPNEVIPLVIKGLVV